ncbi:TatD family hydrolase [Thiomicrorhabdus chilensis]|uniref:TatD family hydrolase n=1 Tax=Thiomicrorhabdus chilensis TaxID=63656 RepID=UPI00040A3C22|nr:TatD family hydrolase [Thiomicrorhabdus chilensis]
MIFDTHCHLDAFTADELSAQLNSNHHYLTMGTSLQNWSTVLRLSSQYPNVFPALGLHPWFVDHNSFSSLVHLESLLENESIHALGEIGLDFSKDYANTKSLQLEIFELQLKLALRFDLPVSLHVYKAHNEMLALLKQYPVKGVLHGLGASIQIAQAYLDLGLLFGVNAVILRSNARRYHQLVSHFGSKSLVLETDAPNVIVPGQDQAQLYDILETLSAVSRLTGESVDSIEKVTGCNAQRIFNLVKE